MSLTVKYHPMFRAAINDLNALTIKNDSNGSAKLCDLKKTVGKVQYTALIEALSCTLEDAIMDNNEEFIIDDLEKILLHSPAISEVLVAKDAVKSSARAITDFFNDKKATINEEISKNGPKSWRGHQPPDEPELTLNWAGSVSIAGDPVRGPRAGY